MTSLHVGNGVFFPKEQYCNFFSRNQFSYLDLKSRQHQTPRISVLTNAFEGSKNSTPECVGHDLIYSDNRATNWGNNNDLNPKKMKFDKDDDISTEKLDQWIRESLVEIVNNLDEAPFLLHIYSSNGGESSTSSRNRVVREKAAIGNWPLVKRRWEEGSPIPDGIILVEELKINEVPLDIYHEEKLRTVDMGNQQLSLTKVWGVLIQGKANHSASCYILKTSRVQSISGFCTHYCLARVECFIEHASVQLMKLWLQR